MSSYTVYVTPRALDEIKALPGHVCQRVKRVVDSLAQDPRPPRSQSLHASGLECDLRRFRLDRWRIVYAVPDQERVVDVLAVRRRPPYDYGDLDELLDRAGL